MAAVGLRPNAGGEGHCPRRHGGGMDSTAAQWCGSDAGAKAGRHPLVTDGAAAVGPAGFRLGPGPGSLALIWILADLRYRKVGQTYDIVYCDV